MGHQTDAAVGSAGPTQADDVRMRVLSEFGILNSPAEQDFDDLTALAARMCDTPVALISLLEADRVWFKSRFGTADNEVARDTSFCHHTVQSEGLLVVPDARQDERFYDSPLVTGDDGYRFYAGAPLVMSDGIAVGALCVLDHVPRELGEQQRAELAMIARQVVSQLELRRASHQLRCGAAATAEAQAELRQNRHLLDEVLAHTDVVVYVKGLDGHFLMANAAAERSVGVAPGGMIGRTVEQIFSPVTAQQINENDALTMLAGSWQVFEEQLVRDDGTSTFRSTKFPLYDGAGQVYAIAGVSTDVTEVAAVRVEMLESERRFRALFEYSPVAIGLSDEHGLWIEVNPACGRFMGVDPARLVGRSSLDFVHADDRPRIAGAEQNQLHSPDQVGATEARFVRPDGSTRWGWLTLTPIPGPNGQQWTLGMLQDITARKLVEDELRRSEEELAAVAAVARCVQSGSDPRPVVVHSVRSLADAAVVRMLEPSDAHGLRVTAPVEDAGTGVAVVNGNAELVRRTGRPVLAPGGGSVDGSTSGPGSMLWEPVVVEGDVIAVLEVGWSRPVTENEDWAVRAVRMLAGETGASLHAAQLRNELERSASTDPLTGALNRRAWDRHLQALSERAVEHGRPLTIALIDLDNFKAFNDGHGHAAGDDLLRDFAADVRRQLEHVGLFARWGGEEFILALADCDSARATEVLEQIRHSVPGVQTCSIGHTVWRAGEPIVSCIGRADVALYAAKARGRDRVVAG